MLLDAGADPNSVCSFSGKLPLAEAARNNHGDIVKDLLKSGADPNKTDHYGITAIDWVTADTRHSLVSKASMLKILLDGGAEVLEWQIK